MSKRLLTPLLFLFILLSMPAYAQAPVYVTLWFDTEDYILPQSDDAALRLAEMLTRLGVRATFKIVGEKARVLEERGRTDVIAALKKHEIGYHSNYHSGQPTPAVYLERMGWEDGAAEFYRREIPGIHDIQRIFGVTPICYGQPGSSWGPQTYPALRRMGVAMYLDEADQVGIDEQPFYYAGMLTVFKMDSTVVRMDLGKENNLAQAREKFTQTVARLRARGGGTISVYYHPCEWVHREFWDGVNFARGANPPRDKWKLPRTQTAEETERNFRDFEQYIKFIQTHPGVSFVTCEDMMRLYEDRAPARTYNQEAIRTLAQAVQKEITFQRMGNVMLSAADTFSILTDAVVTPFFNPPMEVRLTTSLGGPTRAYAPAPGDKRPASVPWEAFARAARDVSLYTRAHGRIPDTVWIGTISISPQDYLATLGGLIESFLKGETGSREVTLREGKITFDKYVAENSAKLWGWVIFPEGFTAPRIMEMARLQAWTIKPALLNR
ncbi:MAG: hypothetical protein ACKV2V_30955 [Blastocatellia bacterium]